MTPAANGPLSRVRTAVRRFLAEHRPARVAVAVSGGADSLALAACTAALTSGARAVVVDHGLQEGSAEVAERAARTCAELGLDAQVRRVEVTGGGGPEAAARRARYAALRPERGLVLLGHTLDDQAETVLLGLGRGSGPRSIAGMRELDAPWGRPLLGVSRADTEGACAELGLSPWSDPHNADPAFTRVRLRREVLPLLEEVLQGGVARALARTAAQLREDNDALDDLADAFAGDRGAVADLAPLPVALRRRVLRRWLLAEGVPELSDSHLRAVDALVRTGAGGGGVWVPGGFVVRRARGRLRVDPVQA
ncbi:tRNA lysidine(34) synthetase TilS [Actinosynnema mirum]|uniref:tRNA(Ile)-lysidine synthase n=1 Tax=Actinosynnema mirum (strain ATCC 29888 / DSM 43827 / JCM 3225 / NBRC 14064 / NCIMB 13271 / NRRL B-12336 / IMRU 3971 / 101) TaxID=446462 RepID=C6WGG3_ACTMD|nr:tRNA lysidine(34) synthetase TilS [Actinosynnema mirum]ACU34279.1 tRNA(Ile)-lysidine synthetase [Actinosynnema mirum DSM 43827]